MQPLHACLCLHMGALLEQALVVLRAKSALNEQSLLQKCQAAANL